jgi:hypothetical protein
MYAESGSTPAQRISEAQKLLEMLKGCDEQMRSDERSFVAGLRERLGKRYARVGVSPKQLFWLRDLKDRYAI